MSKKDLVWNFTPLFSSDNDPEIEKNIQATRSAVEKFARKWQKSSDYLTTPKVLKSALDEYEVLMHTFGTSGDAGYYFSLRSTQDEADPTIRAKFNQVIELSNELQNKIQFFTLNLGKVSLQTQAKFLKSPQLAIYKHFLERLFAEAKYTLSDSEEKILNVVSPTSYGNWVKMTSALLSAEEREVLMEDGTKKVTNFSEILSMMDNKNKKVRDSAAAAFNSILEKYTSVAEAEINSVLGYKKATDTLRGIDRPDRARHMADDIETEIVDTVINTVAAHNAISEKYYTLKARLMKVKKLSYHERNVEFGSTSKKYSFEDGKDMVIKIFKRLDPEFEQIFTRFLKNGQIDVFARRGKRSGAFCATNLLSQPTYVLLNYTDKLSDVTTLAHEMGHAINSELMRQKQHALSFDTPLATAEVASTFMEDFVFEEVLKVATDEEKLSLLMSKVGYDMSAIFRQVACYKFEQELHEEFRKKGYLSHQEIGKIFQKHMGAYMGDAVEQSAGSQNWWIYWNHIRTYFYVYSYASGLLISKSLQAGVRKDPAYIQKVKGFLSAGLSDSPKNIFLTTGIDITKKTFWENGLAEIERLLDETEQLAQKLKKI